MKFIVVDALGSGVEGRHATIDVIGCGPRSVAGVLEKLNMDFDLKPYYNVLSNPSFLRDFDILMVSAMTVDLPTTRRIKRLWDKFRGGLSIIGGPIASDPYDALIRAGYDIAFIGESELTLMEFLKIFNGYDPSKFDGIKGLAYRYGSEIRFNMLRPFMSRGELEIFKPSIKVIKNYWSYYACRVYVEVVRGCSNFLRTKIKLPDGRKCNDCGKCYSGKFIDRYYCPMNIPPGCGYCSVPSLFGPSRSRSINSIIFEIRSLIEIGCRRFILGASDFLDYGRDWVVEPEPLTDPLNPPPNLDAIEGLLYNISNLEREFSTKVFVAVENVKPSLVSDGVAKILGKYLHGTPISIGVETGCESHAKALGRPSTPKQAINAIRILSRHGLKPYAYFIHGLPGQDYRIAERTVKIMEDAVRAGVEKITLYRFTSIPMSAFADFPRSPPSRMDPANMLIANKAAEINSRLKNKWVGMVLDAYIVRSFPDGEKIVGYPFHHGPVIFIENFDVASKFIGSIAKVKVKRVISDRALSGLVLSSY
ncbi:MAG: radical SAM protein [Candidatus Methanomethylicia archaeon]